LSAHRNNLRPDSGVSKKITSGLAKPKAPRLQHEGLWPCASVDFSRSAEFF
jgi:hypothetical protein